MCTQCLQTCTFGLKSWKQIDFLTVVKYKSLFMLLAHLYNMSVNYKQTSPQTRPSAGAYFGHTETDSYIWVWTTTKTYKHDKIQKGLHEIVLRLTPTKFFRISFTGLLLDYRSDADRKIWYAVFKLWAKSTQRYKLYFIVYIKFVYVCLFRTSSDPSTHMNSFLSTKCDRQNKVVRVTTHRAIDLFQLPT
jgi:hypothetical protein